MFRVPLRQQLSREHRQQLIEQLVAEQAEEDREPTLDELHADYVEAQRHESVVNTKVQCQRAELETAERWLREIRAKKLTAGQTEQWRAARIAEIEQRAAGMRAALEDLQPEIDAVRALIDAATPGEQSYRKAVAAVMKSHNAERVRLVRELADAAAKRLAAGREAVRTAPTFADAKVAAGKLADLEVMAWATDRRRVDTEADVKNGPKL